MLHPDAVMICDFLFFGFVGVSHCTWEVTVEFQNAKKRHSEFLSTFTSGTEKKKTSHRMNVGVTESSNLLPQITFICLVQSCFCHTADN